MQKNEDWWIAPLLALIAILLTALPIMSLIDIYLNNRIDRPLMKNLVDIPFYFQLAHGLYCPLATLCLLGVSISIINRIRDPNKELSTPVMGLLLLVVYSLPLIWMLVVVPRYWKVAVYAFIEVIKEFM